MSILPNQVRQFARYNQWANRRLYAAAGALPADVYHAERPSFFGSLHNTLNHVLVGDSVWFGRFIGQPTPHIEKLNQILHPDFASLRSAREMMDERIIAFADSLEDAQLEAKIDYANMSGKRFQHPLAPLLAHFFNHQAHHRGQAHQLLSMCVPGREPPELDLIFYLRESGL
ncbi:DinB family protein [Ferrovibrio sp.]|uniref:DinB family protein n=1 Tax=Ferrovibrio sp. TaxID=1917215 RepID=UPI003D276D6F